MKSTQKLAAILIVVLMVAAAAGVVLTGSSSSSVRLRGRHAAPAQPPLVDQTPLKTAQQLAQMPTTEDEKRLAEEALRLADYGVDLAFAQALKDAKEHPPQLNAEAKAIQARMQKSQKLLAEDKARVEQLDEEMDKAAGAKKTAIDEQLDLVKAQVELDQDELDDAKQDLIRAGGDPEDRIRAMVQEHEELAHGGGGIGAPPAVGGLGLVNQVERWLALHQKQMAIWRAKAAAEAKAGALAAEHNQLAEEIEAAKANSAALKHHAKSAGGTAGSSGAKDTSSGGAAASSSASKRESAAGANDAEDLLDRTQRLDSQQKTLATLDKRAETQKSLSGIYAQWIDVVAAMERAVLRRALIALLVILGILLVAIYFSTLMDKVLGRLKMDRRQVQSLRTVAHVTVRVAALVLILLVIVGPPGQVGTFLGLAGAGLTVALKDFIVGFFGWFVLMGKNGIRLGDWVEINGVTGEVVEIGPFHTVLLETGNWTDSGHPTGRRVTFTNSFAIEGHYFNFSTSGQWLWDELQLVLPAGQDPYPMIGAIQKRVLEATQKSAEQAEAEWRRATGSRGMSSFSVAPAISVKPVVGGIEVAVRYITRANERYQLRAKLYQAAVDLLGKKAVPLEEVSETAS
jgi:small-conductance mechanosensitive channel